MVLANTPAASIMSIDLTLHSLGSRKLPQKSPQPPPPPPLRPPPPPPRESNSARMSFPLNIPCSDSCTAFFAASCARERGEGGASRGGDGSRHRSGVVAPRRAVRDGCAPMPGPAYASPKHVLEKTGGRDQIGRAPLQGCLPAPQPRPHAAAAQAFRGLLNDAHLLVIGICSRNDPPGPGCGESRARGDASWLHPSKRGAAHACPHARSEHPPPVSDARPRSWK